MKTRKTKNLFFQFESLIPRDWTVFEFAEFLIYAGLIEAVERDLDNGTVTRYAETEALFRSEDKFGAVREALEAARVEVKHG